MSVNLVAYMYFLFVLFYSFICFTAGVAVLRTVYHSMTGAPNAVRSRELARVTTKISGLDLPLWKDDFGLKWDYRPIEGGNEM